MSANSQVTLIDIGDFSAAEVDQALAPHKGNIVLLSRREDVLILLKALGYQCKRYESGEFTCTAAWVGRPERPDRTAVFNRVLDHHETLQLSERNSRRADLHVLLRDRTFEVYKIFNRAYDFFAQVDVRFYLCMATPHNVHSWTYAITAQEMGIRVGYLQTGLLPWLRGVYEGIGRDRGLLRCAKPLSLPWEGRVTQDYLTQKRGSMSSALPFYERQRKLASHSPGRIAAAIIQRNRIPLVGGALQNYNAMRQAMKPKPPGPYAVFFLHYQPERTTLPEGWGFSQQLIAIDTLRRAMPAQLPLLVKEHPSTYLYSHARTSRSPAFYRELAAISGVHFIGLECDQYDLIDHAEFVATITGSAAWEAIIRMKPAIVFGRGSFGCHDTVHPHVFNTAVALKSYIEALPASDADFDRSVATIIEFEQKNYYCGLSPSEQLDVYPNTAEHFRSCFVRASLNAAADVASARITSLAS